MDELPVHKLIIDSRAADLGIPSDFQVTLPETIHMPPDGCLYVTDVCISHTFRTVESHANVEGRNHFVYVLEQLWTNGVETLRLNRATLASRSYSPEELATELQ